MANESFNIIPGMSAWVDMNKKYKNAYYRHLEAEKKKEINDEPLPEIDEVPEIEEVIDIPETCICSEACDDDCDCDCHFEEKLNICPVCGIDMPDDKKFCSKECFYKRGTINS